MIRKLEVLANVAIIIVALVFCAVFAKKHLFVNSQTNSATAVAAKRSITPDRIKTGEKISIPGIDWAEYEQTLLLVLSTTCRFCTESAPFYQKLEKEKPANVRLVAILPQEKGESRNYLNNLGLSLPDIVQTSPASIGLSGTPTLILIDNNGVVKQSWVGKLAEADSAKVIAELSSRVGVDNFKR